MTTSAPGARREPEEGPAPDLGPGQEDSPGPDTAFRELRTARLVLRRFTAEDAPALAGYRSDPDVARFQSWEAPFGLDQAATFIAQLADTHPDTPGAWFQLAVEEQATGTLVGDVAAFVDDEDPRLARVGVTFARSAQGRGYATEALRALLGYLLVTRGKHRVSADCDLRNAPSRALLRRVGMRHEATHRRSAWWKGEWTDEEVYAVLAEEWPPAGSRTGDHHKG